MHLDEINMLIDYLMQQHKCYEHCSHVSVMLSEEQMNFILDYLCDVRLRLDCKEKGGQE